MRLRAILAVLAIFFASAAALADPVDGECINVYGDIYDDCAGIANCSQLQACVCGAADESSPAPGKSAHHDDAGCSVGGAGPDLPLFATMIAIGGLAFALGRRTKKSGWR